MHLFSILILVVTFEQFMTKMHFVTFFILGFFMCFHLLFYYCFFCFLFLKKYIFLNLFIDLLLFHFLLIIFGFFTCLYLPFSLGTA